MFQRDAQRVVVHGLDAHVFGLDGHELFARERSFKFRVCICGLRAIFIVAGDDKARRRMHEVVKRRVELRRLAFRKLRMQGRLSFQIRRWDVGLHTLGFGRDIALE